MSQIAIQQFAVDAPTIDGRSDLLKAQSRASGRKVNACPYGCTFAKLDESCYCRHLIGFTNDKKTYEPHKRIGGRRVVVVPMVATEEIAEWSEDGDGPPVIERVMVPRLPLVKPDDVLIQISTSWRVYRDVDKLGKAPQPKMESTPVALPNEDVARELIGGGDPVKDKFEALRKNAVA